MLYYADILTARLKKVLFNWYNVRFGVFLAANIGGFKLLEVLLLLLPVGHNTRMTLAGVLMQSASVFYLSVQ
jgi:hypothetical protein